MTIKTIQTAIKSYKARKAQSDQDAIDAIKAGCYEVAARKVAESSAFNGAIEELEFVLECMEVE